VRNFGSLFVLALSVLTFAAAGAVVWGSYQFVTSEFPDVSVVKTRYPVVRYQGKKQPATVTISKLRPSGWTSLGEVSKVAVGAIVVSEDWAFYQHKGYDANQIKEAIKEDWEEGRFARGASTITQQVVRNVFLDKDKNLWRKVKELILAVRIEESVGKRRILEIYLNIAEWGEGIFGIRQAARHYFGKDPSQLTAREGAFLAMLLPSPKRYSQSFRVRKLTAYARETVESILGKMTQARYLTEEERAAEMSAALSFEADAGPLAGAGAGAAEPRKEGEEDEEEGSEPAPSGENKDDLPSGRAF
jgi:monofunctional biosynthetic peptidoglycan transglycosylase